MIHGRFGDTTGRPYLEGKLALPHQLGNVWAWCSFIIDTGAERSVLVPVDARRMGLDRAGLTRPSNSLGIGGNAKGHDEFAIIVLGDDERGRLYEFRVEVFIPEDTADMREIDGSVLGRDILNHAELLYSRAAVTLDVKSWEREWEVTPGKFGAEAPHNVLR